MDADEMDVDNGSQNDTEEEEDDEDDEGNRTGLDGASDVAEDDEDEEDEDDDEEDDDDEAQDDDDEEDDEDDDDDGDDEDDEDDADGAAAARGSHEKASPTVDPETSPATYVETSKARLAKIVEGAQSSRNADAYTIEPVGAAPHSAHIHAMALSADGTNLVTGGSDGHVRRYDVYASMNGRTPLTQNVRHQYVDGVVKAGVMTTWWANEERPTFKDRGMNDDDDDDDNGGAERLVSPVHSLAIQRDALWCLAGSESGNINLASLRHEPGQLRHVFRKHTSAVSAMALANDDTELLSGGWDRNLHQWDLNTGQIVRSFPGHTGHVTSISLRPLQSGETWSRSNSPSISIRIATPVERAERNDSVSKSPKKTSPLAVTEKSEIAAASTGPSVQDAETTNAVGSTPLTSIKLESETSDTHTAGNVTKDDDDNDSLFGDEMDVEKNLDEALGLGASQSMNMGMDMTMNDGELEIPLQTNSKKRQADDSDDGDSLFGGDAASADGSPINANTAPEMQPDTEADAEGEDEDAEGEDEDAEGEDDDAEGEDDDQPLAALAASSRTPIMSTGIGLPGAGLSRQNTNHDSPLTLPNGHAGPAESTSTSTSASTTKGLPKPAFGGRSAIASFDSDVSRFSNDVMLTSTLGGQVTLWDRRVPSYPGSSAGNPSNGHATHKGVRALALPDKTPPWCTSACWNSRGDKIYVGRRNETIDEWDLRMLPDHTANGSTAGLGRKSDARFARSIRMPAGSGAITSVLGMPNGRHLVCGSYDNVRLWDTLAHTSNTSSVPFRIVAGHHGAVVSDILLDPTARFLFTSSGDRGWMSNSTESVILHEVRSL